MDALVDVNIAVYNHAPYLRQTLDSVLAQKTNFDVRLLIGDDFSTDGSREILKEYESKFPDKVKVIYQEKNLGFSTSETNGIIIFRNSTAKYIAFLDGDDYWVDTEKLQKQIDFLEANKDYVACSSNVFEKTKDELKPITVGQKILTFNDFTWGNSIYTSSVVFRNIIKLPEWYTECKMGDWIIWLMLTQKGHIYNFEEKMAVYRMHNSGIWIGQGRERNLRNMIHAYDILQNKLDPKYKHLLKKGAKHYYNQLLQFFSENRSSEIFSWTNKSFFRYYDIKQLKYLLKYFMYILMPKKLEVEPVKE